VARGGGNRPDAGWGGGVRWGLVLVARFWRGKAWGPANGPGLFRGWVLGRALSRAWDQRIPPLPSSVKHNGSRL
jgi:hypothetical protein